MQELANITIKGFRSIAAIENLALGAINVLIRRDARTSTAG